MSLSVEGSIVITALMRIGIITDIHENEAALREALKKAAVHQCDEIACLGDIVGYDTRFYDHTSHRSASACIRIIRASCRWIVAGNHDLNAACRIPLVSNGFKYPDGWFGLNQSERKKISAGKVWCYESEGPNDLDENDLEFLRNLPEFIISDEPGISCLFSHYIIPDPTGSTTRYIERKGQLMKHWDFMKLNNLCFSFIGHSHNHFAGFAYKRNGSLFRAFHVLPQDNFYLGKEPVVIMLPPLSGEKGRTGFSIVDTKNLKLNIIAADHN